MVSRYLPQKYKLRQRVTKDSFVTIFDDWFQNMDIDLSLWGCLEDAPADIVNKFGQSAGTVYVSVGRRR